MICTTIEVNGDGLVAVAAELSQDPVVKDPVLKTNMSRATDHIRGKIQELQGTVSELMAKVKQKSASQETDIIYLLRSKRYLDGQIMKLEEKLSHLELMEMMWESATSNTVLHGPAVNRWSSPKVLNCRDKIKDDIDGFIRRTLIEMRVEQAFPDERDFLSDVSDADDSDLEAELQEVLEEHELDVLTLRNTSPSPLTPGSAGPVVHERSDEHDADLTELVAWANS